jgi:hypothetical protein
MPYLPRFRAARECVSFARGRLRFAGSGGKGSTRDRVLTADETVHRLPVLPRLSLSKTLPKAARLPPSLASALGLA